jgi:hypothetical protein
MGLNLAHGTIIHNRELIRPCPEISVHVLTVCVTKKVAVRLHPDAIFGHLELGYMQSFYVLRS